MPTDLIDINAAAKILKVSTRRVRTLCAEGRVKGARMIGGSWIIVAEVKRNGKVTIEVEPREKGPKLGA